MYKKILLIVGLCLFVTGCVTEHKAVGVSNGIEGFKLEVVGSATGSSMPFPIIWLANDTFSYASAPAIKKDEATQVVFTMTKRRSFFGSLFGIDDSSISMSYIGLPNESADDTAKRINSFTGIVDKTETTTAK